MALEAMEGTDEVIRRAGRIAGPGCTVVKVAKPQPGHALRRARWSGAGTLEAMREAGARRPGRGGGRDAALDRAAFLAAGRRGGIAVVGLERPRG